MGGARACDPGQSSLLHALVLGPPLCSPPMHKCGGLHGRSCEMDAARLYTNAGFDLCTESDVLRRPADLSFRDWGFEDGVASVQAFCECCPRLEFLLCPLHDGLTLGLGFGLFPRSCLDGMACSCVRSPLMCGESFLHSVPALRVLQCQDELARNWLCCSEGGSTAVSFKDVGSGFLDGLLDRVADYVCCFCRSFLVWYLLAIGHLICRAVPCRAGCEGRNRGIRTLRCGFQGAPIVLAFMFFAHALPLTLAAPSDALGNAAVCESCDVPQAVGSFPEVNACHETRWTVPCEGQGLLPAGSGSSGRLDFKFQVSIVQFQRPCLSLEQWWDEGIGAAYVCAEVADELSFDPALNSIIPVVPQPSLDVAVVLEVPPWLLTQMWIPVLIQIGEPVRHVFMDFFVGHISCSDIRLSAGDLWPVGANVFHGDSEYPMNEDEWVVAVPGALFRVTASRHVPRARSLDFKLCRPHGRLHNLLAGDARSLEPQGSYIGAVGPLADWQTCRVHHGMIPRDVHEGLLHGGARPGSFLARLPAAVPYDLAFRGTPVRELIGFLPRCLESCVYLFVDPRALGRPVCVLLVPPIPMTIPSLLARLHATYPAHLRLRVVGAPDLVQSTQMFIPGNAALITFALEHPDAEDSLNMSLAAPTPSHVPPLPQLHVCAALPSSKCAGEAPPTGGRDQHGDGPDVSINVGDSALSNDASRTWFCGRPEDASAYVGQGAGAPHRDFQRGRDVLERHGPEHDDGGDGPPDDDSDDVDDDEEMHPDEWMVLIRLLRFQAPDEFRSLWVARGEDVDSFMLRARILLLPLSGFFELTMPPSQPDPSCITLIASPSWWRLDSVHSILLADVGEPSSVYTAVVRPDDDVEDHLPLHAQPRAERVHLFTDYMSTDADLFSWPHPPMGGLVAVVHTDGAAPLFPDAASSLMDPRRAILADAVPVVRHSPGNWQGLLGARFECGCIELQQGSVQDQVCRVVDMAPDEVHIWVQLVPFSAVAIQGRDVGRCIAYRPRATTDYMRVVALFIDGRKVGRPVCCVCASQGFLNAVEVLRLLDVKLPMGYRAMHARAQTEEPIYTALLFSSGQSVVVWADQEGLGPTMSLHVEEHEDDESGSSDVQDESVDGVDGPGATRGAPSSRLCGQARSRSPRRGGRTRRVPDVGAGSPPTHTPSRAVPTPCRGARLPGVGLELRRFAMIGAAMMLCALDGVDGLQICRTSFYGDFFTGDCGLMWMPGLGQHAHALCHLADTPKERAPEMIAVSDYSTVLACSSRRQWRCHLGQRWQAIQQAYAEYDGTPVPLYQHAVPPDGRYTLCLSTSLDFGDAQTNAVQQLEEASPFAIETFSLDAGQCDTPWHDELDRDLRRFVPFGQLCSPPLHLTRPGRFLGWVRRGCRRSLAPGEVLQVTADGSFDPQTGRAGWGIAFAATGEVDSASTFLGCCWGSLATLSAVQSLLPYKVDAFVAEIAGLFWAAVGVLQLRVASPVCFRCDNHSALGIAAGSFQAPAFVLSRAMRAIHMCVGQATGHAVSYCHVRGHQGDAANELADALAEEGSGQGKESGPFALDLQKQFANGSGAFEWAAHALWSQKHPGIGPELHDGVMSWNRRPPGLCASPAFSMAPFLPAPQRATRKSAPGTTLNLGLASYNCLSLMDKPGPRQAEAALLQTGRAKLLALTFSQARIHVAGVQECRSKPGMFRCNSFVRFASGSTPEGNYGVELWIDEGRPVAWTSGSPIFLRSADVVVLQTDPTWLIARLHNSVMDLMLLVGHGPHRAHTEQVRSHWWTEVTARCCALDHGGTWLLMLDANARVGSVISAQIGPRDRDAEDLSGTGLHVLLRSLRAFLPSTFDEFSSGPSGTICQRRNSEFGRGGFLGIPESWKEHALHAYVEPSISAGHQVVDHLAVVCHGQVHMAVDPTRQPRRRLRIDQKQLFDPANRALVQGIVASIPDIPWSISVHEHCSILTSHLQSQLSLHFPPPQRGMRADYFGEDTVALHRTLCSLRNEYHRQCHALKLARLRCAFLQWREQRPDMGLFERLQGRWLGEMYMGIAFRAGRVRSVAVQLRRQCKHDKAQYLQQLAEDVDSSGPREVQLACRRLLQPRKKRSSLHRPLPSLRKADGTLCMSSDEVVQCGRDHFAALESGYEVQADDLVRACVRDQCEALGPESIVWRHLPSMRAAEQALRQVQGCAVPFAATCLSRFGLYS